MRTVPLILSSLTLAGCGSVAGASQSNAPRASEQFAVADFHAISAAGAQDVIVTTGGSPSVRVEGPQKAIDQLEIEVEDGTLKIGTKKGVKWSWSGQDQVTVYVSAPRVEGAALAGSGDLSVDRAESESFKASLAGSGNLKIGTLRADAAEFSLAGSGNIQASGGVSRTKMSLAGSGNMVLTGLQSRDAKLSIAGSGNINTNVTGTAEVSIAGSGDATLAGGAKCSVSKRGSGDARCS